MEAIRRQNFQERKELQRRMAGVRAPVAPAVQVKSNSPGAHFSTVPKLFGRISWGQNSLCIFKKKASRATILGSYFNFDSLYNTDMKRPALRNKWVGVLRIPFRMRKVFGTFEKRPLEQRIIFLLAFNVHSMDLK